MDATVTPLRQPTCPLCGGANACVPAATGSFSEPCWCEALKFEASLLAQANPGACICRTCATATASAATPSRAE